MNPAPGFKKYPEHRLEAAPAKTRVRVTFKGEVIADTQDAASYFSLRNGPQNAVWSYEQPYDEMAAIKDLLAFYPDKVDGIAVG